ncbi:MAG: hypothetical protein ACOVQR_04645 [Flavobacterium sp.]|jgi:hypothetical protein
MYSFFSVTADEVQLGFETPLFLKIGHQQRVPQPRTNIEQNPKETRSKQQSQQKSLLSFIDRR